MIKIALVGGIAVGKSFWGKQLCEKLESCQFIEEDTNENIFLSDFYSDMKKWGFHSRISMLSMILSNLKKIDDKKDYIIFDRCIPELIVFAQKEYDEGNMSEKEFALYNQLYTGIENVAPKPDLYLFFHCSPEISLNRIKLRGRACEKDVDLAFCQDVFIRYNDWCNRQEGYFIDVNTDGSQINIDALVEQIKNFTEKNAHG